MTARRVLLTVPIALSLVLAPAARAAHAIRWGAGPDCPSATRSASATVDSPVRFVVCVTLDGEPVAGHPMSVRVAGPVREVELDIETDADGIARFGVQPTAAGETTVTLCDDEGCSYGDTVIVVDDAPATTTPDAATSPSTATTAAAAPRPSHGADDGAGTAGGLVAGVVAAVGAVLALRWWRGRRVPDVAVPEGLDGTLTRDDLRALASLDPALLDAASAAARAAPPMGTEDQLDFFLADIYRRADAAVHEQMDVVQLLGPGDSEVESQKLARLLESRAAVGDVRRRVAERLAAAPRDRRDAHDD